MTAAANGDEVLTASSAHEAGASTHCSNGSEQRAVDSRGRSPVLRLRGLPFSASNSDVEAFFAEFGLKSIYICRRDGRSTGEAYVVLQSPEDAQKALANLNKRYMGSRYIELFEAAEADLAAVKRVLEDTRLQGYVVRLRGLPYSATTADILQFFSGVQLVDDEDAVVFAQSVDGRPTGEAYVELANEQALSLAMTRHKELMGSRYIEIFNSSKVDKIQALQQARFHLEAGQKPRRWPPVSAVSTTGMCLNQLPGTAALTGTYTGLPSPDQLADAFRATHIKSIAGAATAGAVWSAPMPYPMSACPAASSAAGGGTCVFKPAAAAAAGLRASEPPAPAAGVQPNRALQMMQPQGAVMIGPDGQPAMYYMHPQDMMWPGQLGTGQHPAGGMVPVVPISSPAVANMQAMMPAAPGWPEGYQQQGYKQQMYPHPGAPHIVAAAGGIPQYGPVPYMWPQGMPPVPLPEPRAIPTSMAANF